MRSSGFDEDSDLDSFCHGTLSDNTLPNTHWEKIQKKRTDTFEADFFLFLARLFIHWKHLAPLDFSCVLVLFNREAYNRSFFDSIERELSEVFEFRLGELTMRSSSLACDCQFHSHTSLKRRVCSIGIRSVCSKICNLNCSTGSSSLVLMTRVSKNQNKFQRNCSSQIWVSKSLNKSNRINRIRAINDLFILVTILPLRPTPG